jgi:hypothetical protein
MKHRHIVISVSDAVEVFQWHPVLNFDLLPNSSFNIQINSFSPDLYDWSPVASKKMGVGELLRFAMDERNMLWPKRKRRKRGGLLAGECNSTAKPCISLSSTSVNSSKLRYLGFAAVNVEVSSLVKADTLSDRAFDITIETGSSLTCDTVQVLDGIPATVSSKIDGYSSVLVDSYNFSLPIIEFSNTTEIGVKYGLAESRDVLTVPLSLFTKNLILQVSGDVFVTVTLSVDEEAEVLDHLAEGQSIVIRAIVNESNIVGQPGWPTGVKNRIPGLLSGALYVDTDGSDFWKVSTAPPLVIEAPANFSYTVANNYGGTVTFSILEEDTEDVVLAASASASKVEGPADLTELSQNSVIIIIAIGALVVVIVTILMYCCVIRTRGKEVYEGEDY